MKRPDERMGHTGNYADDTTPDSSDGDGAASVGSDSGDQSSYAYSMSGRQTISSSASTASEEKSVGRWRPSRWLLGSKTIMCVILLLAAVSSAIVVYRVASDEEHQGYKTRFRDVANSLHDVSELNAKAILETSEAVALQMTAFFEIQNVTWPFVSIPTFEAQAQQLAEFTGTNSVGINVLVKEDEVDAYEKYVNDNLDWLDMAKKFEGDEGGERPPYSPIIYVTAGGGLVKGAERTDTGYFAPYRHVSPIRLTPYAYNLDALAVEPTKTTIENIMKLKTTIFSTVNNLDNPAEIRRKWPSSFLGVPIFDSIFESERALKAVLSVNVNWHEFFENVVTEDIDQVYVVISNTCGQEFSYLIDGPEVMYLGNHSIHEDLDGNVEHVYDFSAIKSFEDCTFQMHVYPSSEFYDTYHTSEPLRSTLMVIGTFLLTAIVFLMYDVFVERRQAYVMKKAQRSDALINSLFPASVKDRLMPTAAKKPEPRFFPFRSHFGGAANPESSSDEGNKGLGKGQFMDPGLDLMASTTNKPMPIADLFLHVTVMFADIVGFTAWSSMREPAQVFSLLETLYSSFDRIAKKLKVFKVETVGDCYVAAAGLPDPTPDHAVIMVRFAKLCVSKLRVVMRDLAAKLGPDTGDLTMRFGLHSGPVTAGVLRGEKSRFQLFGDTVNTAARIEALGAPNKIQVSQDTADALTAAGKKAWLEPRADRICAKGKGELQTYWIIQKIHEEMPILQAMDTVIMNQVKVGNAHLHVDTQHESSEQSATSTTHDSSRALAKKMSSESLNTFTEQHSSGNPKHTNSFVGRRYGAMSNTSQLEVQWNADVMKGMIRRILAMRSKDQLKLLNSPKSRHGDIKLPQRHGTALDEVQEVIKLPSESLPYQQDPSAIELSPAVRSQVDHFVFTISQMYRSNPFHSFSHASHVVQSTVKLLSRIVRKEAIDYNDMCYKESNGDALHKFTFGITSDPITQFACVLAALIHDVDHTGLPNSQLVKEGVDIASKYKNKSVAEQNSFDIAWDLMMSPQYREMRECIYSTKQELMRFRQLLVNAVLATDIMDKELNALRKARWAKAFDKPQAKHTRLDHSGTLTSDSSKGSNSEEDANRMATIVIEHLIQASDVSHTMQHWHVYQKWNEKLFHEMYVAYKAGKAENDPSLGWYKGELGFFDFYIIPLAKKLKDCGVFGVSSDEYLNYAQANRQEWATRGQDVVARYIRKESFGPQEDI